MQIIDGRWVISPQDLVSELECHQRVALNAAVKQGLLDAPQSDESMLRLLQRRGQRHEVARLTELRDLRIFELPALQRWTADELAAAWQATESAMLQEFDVIYQATLYTGDFLGLADFLIISRDENDYPRRGEDGRVVYEPVDAKSAMSAKRAAALQVGAYAETLVRLGWPRPTKVHLWLAGESNDWSGPAERFIAVAREVRERLQAKLPHLTGVPSPEWAAPREACPRCRWEKHCDEGRHQARDLSMIQGIRSTTRERLVSAGISTIDDMSTATDAARPPRVGLETFDRLRDQAALQIRGGRDNTIVWEVTDPTRLGSLPPRSPGDVWFDMEGFPGWDNGVSLEYMFGVGCLQGQTFDFQAFEAVDRSTERQAFIDFVDFVMDRLRQYPDLHVYHYADYERRTLLELAQRHGVREQEVDHLVRSGTLVDFYEVVRHSMRFSTESLSLKYIEPVYGHQRPKGEDDVSTALGSVIEFERAMLARDVGDISGFEKILSNIRYYNKDDCLSTYELDRWLRSIAQVSSEFALPRDLPGEEDVESATEAERVADALLQGVPIDRAERTPDQHAQALLAATLDYHRREERPQWWKIFDWAQSDLAVLEDDSSVLVVDQAEASAWGRTGRQRKDRRRLTLSSATQQARDVFDAQGPVFLLYDEAPDGMFQPAGTPRGFHQAQIVEVGRDSLVVEEAEGKNGETWGALPIAVLPGPPVNAGPIRRVLQELGDQVLQAVTEGRPAWPDAVWADLLRGRPPRRSATFPRTRDDIADITGALRDSSSYVAVQGPPGTGKTYVGSRVVSALASEGWRIGVVAQSHSVVDNFLEAVHEADPSVPIGKETQGSKAISQPWEVSKLETFTSSQSGGFVIGGTAWTLCRQNVRDLRLDLLVIDEAGQFALTNAIAASASVERVLLLGDPQQLPQVSQGSHPEPVEASVLRHVSGGEPVLPKDRGYFLEQTYRMHPALTDPVSRLQYEGKLTSADVTSMRSLDGVAPGVIPVPVAHVGNTTSSPEEAGAVVDIVRGALGRAWRDAKNGAALSPRPAVTDDIIVVAAYNAQVRLIRRRLEEAGIKGVAVGTVDKFQGREAPIVILSMATSSGDDLPRGLDFLLSPNRLNVAVSRGQWACYVVHSPALREVAPSSVEGLGSLGAFIGLLRDRTPPGSLINDPGSTVGHSP